MNVPFLLSLSLCLVLNSPLEAMASSIGTFEMIFMDKNKVAIDFFPSLSPEEESVQREQSDSSSDPQENRETDSDEEPEIIKQERRYVYQRSKKTLTQSGHRWFLKHRAKDLIQVFDDSKTLIGTIFRAKRKLLVFNIDKSRVELHQKICPGNQAPKEICFYDKSNALVAKHTLDEKDNVARQLTVFDTQIPEAIWAATFSIHQYTPLTFIPTPSALTLLAGGTLLGSFIALKIFLLIGCYLPVW